MVCHSLWPSPHQQSNDIYWIKRPTVQKFKDMNFNGTDFKGIVIATFCTKNVFTFFTLWWPQLHSTYHQPQVSSIQFVTFLRAEGTRNYLSFCWILHFIKSLKLSLLIYFIIFFVYFCIFNLCIFAILVFNRYQSMHLSIYNSIYLCFYLLMHPSIYVSVYLPMCLPINVYINLRFNLSIHQLSFYLSVHLYPHLATSMQTRGPGFVLFSNVRSKKQLPRYTKQSLFKRMKQSSDAIFLKSDWRGRTMDGLFTTQLAREIINNSCCTQFQLNKMYKFSFHIRVFLSHKTMAYLGRYTQIHKRRIID